MWMLETKPDEEEASANWCIMAILVYFIFIERLLISLYQPPLLNKDES